jgi:hypothetical protein
MSTYPTDADPPPYPGFGETGPDVEPYGLLTGADGRAVEAYDPVVTAEPAGTADGLEEYEAGAAGTGSGYATHLPGERPAAGAGAAGEPGTAAGGTDWEDGGAGEPVVPEVARVAAAVTEMDAVVELPVGEHVARYEALHGELSDALASIDEV